MEIKIELTARFLSPFNVGSGALGDALTNKPTLKDGRSRPIIPASAFKGRLRHTCERLLKTLQEDDHAVCQAPDPAAACPLSPHWLNDYCPACRLFGSPKRPSPLTFSDWTWALSDAAPTQIRAGVSIRRSRRVAEPQRLYDLEAADPLTAPYKGVIQGHLADDDAPALAALLWAGIRDLKSIGGGRGSGLGRCKIEAVVRIDGRKVDESWLRQGLTHWRQP